MNSHQYHHPLHHVAEAQALMKAHFWKQCHYTHTKKAKTLSPEAQNFKQSDYLHYHTSYFYPNVLVQGLDEGNFIYICIFYIYTQVPFV